MSSAAKPKPPAGYPAQPACFTRHDLASLEQQRQFYQQAYGSLPSTRAPASSQPRIQYVLDAIAYEQGRGGLLFSTDLFH